METLVLAVSTSGCDPLSIGSNPIRHPYKYRRLETVLGALEMISVRASEEYATTTNSTVYRRLRKRLLADTGEIRCHHCRPHVGEDARPKDWDRQQRLLARLGEDYFETFHRYRPLI